MVTISVNGKDYEIDERQEGLMVFVQKAKAIEQRGIKINNIDDPTFDFVIRIFAEMKYDIEEQPKVSTS
jgi:hypothetical protein